MSTRGELQAQLERSPHMLLSRTDGANLERIEALQAELEFRLPDSYRWFLQRYGSARYREFDWTGLPPAEWPPDEEPPEWHILVRAQRPAPAGLLTLLVFDDRSSIYYLDEQSAIHRSETGSPPQPFVDSLEEFLERAAHGQL